MARPVKYPGVAEFIKELYKKKIKRTDMFDIVEERYNGISRCYVSELVKGLYDTKSDRSKTKKDRVKYMLTLKGLPRRQILDKMKEKFNIKENTAIGYYTEHLAVKKTRKKNEKKARTKMKRCIMCHEDFETEIDEMGVPYKCRCPKCTAKLKLDRLNVAAIARMSR